MSILLSAYYPEGIVFAADKNATISVASGAYVHKRVEPTLTKVLAWPNRRAAVGFVGVAAMAGVPMDEWLRIFIAGTRDFEDVGDLAAELRERIERDFLAEFSANEDHSGLQLVLHLGAFRVRHGVAVPVMYHIWNHGPIDTTNGHYPQAERHFRISEDFEASFRKFWPGDQYPTQAQTRLSELLSRRKYLWYNNGANIGAFNVFKAFLWQSLNTIRDAGFRDELTGLDARAAYCKMAVEVFGSYFTHHYRPPDRVVGGGVDVVQMAWPEGDGKDST